MNADSADLLATNQTELTDKNLFSYCDNNPVNRADGDGDLWKLALASGGALGALGSSALAAIGAVATAGAVAVGIVATVAVVVKVVEVSINIYRSARSKSGSGKVESDPYARPGQKRQGRERKNKARQSDKWKPKSKPKPPKKHTPGRGHRKYR